MQCVDVEVDGWKNNGGVENTNPRKKTTPKGVHGPQRIPPLTSPVVQKPIIFMSHPWLDSISRDPAKEAHPQHPLPLALSGWDPTGRFEKTYEKEEDCRDAPPLDVPFHSITPTTHHCHREENLATSYSYADIYNWLVFRTTSKHTQWTLIGNVMVILWLPFSGPALG